MQKIIEPLVFPFLKIAFAQVLLLVFLGLHSPSSRAASSGWWGQSLQQCSEILTSWGFGAVAQERRLEQASWHLEEVGKIAHHIELALSPNSNTPLEGARMMVLHGAIHEHLSQARSLYQKSSQLPAQTSLPSVEEKLKKTFALVELERLLQSQHGLTLSGVDSETFSWIQEQLEQKPKGHRDLADQLAQTKALLTLDHSVTERLHSLDSVVLLSGIPFTTLKELLDLFPEALPQIDNPHFVRSLAERVFARQKPSPTEEENENNFYDRNLLYLYYASARTLRVSPDQARKEGLIDLHHLERELFEKANKKQQEVEDMLQAIHQLLSP